MAENKGYVYNIWSGLIKIKKLLLLFAFLNSVMSKFQKSLRMTEGLRGYDV
jgi:hypothetical protein